MNQFGKIGMRHWRSVWRVGLVLAPIFALFLLLPGANRRDTRHPTPTARAEAATIKAAIHQYHSEYGKLPQGSNDDIFQLLTGTDRNGKNPREIVFLSWNPHRRGLVDPWGTPYRIVYSDPDQVRVTSAGKDKVFDNADDIYSSSRRSNR